MTDQPIVIERRYAAAARDLWALWTSPEGLERWRGPPGFAVTVQQMDLRPGDLLRYSMIAEAPQMVAFMQANGMPTVTPCQAVYNAIMPMTRLPYRNLVDFAPYHTNMAVDVEPQGAATLLRLTFDPMHDPKWSARQRRGWDQELGKLEAILAQSA